MNQYTRTAKRAVLAVLVGALGGTTVAADDRGNDNRDFGSMVESLLNGQSQKLFGVGKPLEEPAPETDGPYRTSRPRFAALLFYSV